jgi:hypothetical protein
MQNSCTSCHRRAHSVLQMPVRCQPREEEEEEEEEEEGERGEEKNKEVVVVVPVLARL